jgi:hypothetical protein
LTFVDSAVTFHQVEFLLMKRALFLLRLFALFSLLAGLAVFYDLFLGSPENDSAVVTQKSKTRGQGNIHAQGRFHYYEGVPQRFYDLCERGDTLQLSLTPIFKEWRRASLIRGGSVLGGTVGNDIFWMGGFGCIFLFVAGVSFFAPAHTWQKPVSWVVVSVVELVAVLLFLKYLAVLGNLCEKM